MRPVTHVDPVTGAVLRSKVQRTGSATCKCGKQGYSSKKLAKATAANQSRETGERIEAYHCFGGHCYHIGHPPKPYDFEAHRAAS